MDRDDAILDYLQHRMAPDAREAFEAELSRDAPLAAEVAVMRAARETLAEGPRHEKAQMVWDKLSAQMEDEPKAANDNRSPVLQILKYAAVAVIAVAAWQFAVVPRTAIGPDGFRTASEEATSFVLQVRFVDAATLGDIGALLAPLGGTISDGPSALGVLRVSFPDAEAVDKAAQTLTARTDLVEFVAVQ